MKWAALAAAVVAAGALALVLTGGDPASALYVDRDSLGGRCDDGRGTGDVSRTQPWCSLGRAARAAPAGSTVVVRDADYPRLDISGHKNGAPVVFRPEGSGSPALNGLRMDASSGFTFRGLRITDASRLEDVAGIRFEANDVSPSDIVVGGGRELAFEGNTFHDLTIRLDPVTKRCQAPRCGFGLRLSRVAGVSIAGNEFRRIPADGIQMAAAEKVVIEKNRFADIRAFIDPREHSDSIQVVGRSDRVTIRGNTFKRVRGIIVQPLDNVNFRGYSERLRIERNRFSDLHDWAMTLLDTPRARITGNVARGPRGDIRLFDQADFPARTEGVVLVGNAINALEAKPAMFARADDNVIATSR